MAAGMVTHIFYRASSTASWLHTGVSYSGPLFLAIELIRLPLQLLLGCAVRGCGAGRKGAPPPFTLAIPTAVPCLLGSGTSSYVRPLTERTPTADEAVDCIEENFAECCICWDHFAFRTFGVRCWRGRGGAGPGAITLLRSANHSSSALGPWVRGFTCNANRQRCVEVAVAA